MNNILYKNENYTAPIFIFVDFFYKLFHFSLETGHGSCQSIRVLETDKRTGPDMESMTNRAVSPYRRIGDGIAEGRGAVSCTATVFGIVEKPFFRTKKSDDFTDLDCWFEREKVRESVRKVSRPSPRRSLVAESRSMQHSTESGPSNRQWLNGTKQLADDARPHSENVQSLEAIVLRRNKRNG